MIKALKQHLVRQLRMREEPASAASTPVPDAPCGWAPGHFYSPIPSLKEIGPREAEIFDRSIRELPGIELHTTEQLALLGGLARFFDDFPFTAERQAGLRFFYDNPNFAFGEALILTSWLRHFRPRRVFEIGSGYSSCAMLDVVDLFLAGRTECRFLEPHPELVLGLLSAEDRSRVQVTSSRVQDVDLSWFGELEAGDLLFIDSSHVSKVDSDVNLLLFTILPSLASGVTIHFHDIYYPFEYPREWVYQGRAWNEAYLLRAFLQYNADFKIRLWNDYISRACARAGLALPRFVQQPGSSIWLEKVGAPQPTERAK